MGSEDRDIDDQLKGLGQPAATSLQKSLLTRNLAMQMGRGAPVAAARPGIGFGAGAAAAAAGGAEALPERFARLHTGGGKAKAGVGLGLGLGRSAASKASAADEPTTPPPPHIESPVTATASSSPSIAAPAAAASPVPLQQQPHQPPAPAAPAAAAVVAASPVSLDPPTPPSPESASRSCADDSGSESGGSSTSSSHKRSVPTGKHLLLVEDVRVSQRIAQMALKRAKYSVDVADTGEQAVEMYTKGDYGVILMDIHMPGMDGVEATRRIRAWEREHKRDPVTILGLTGNFSPDDLHTYQTAQMNGCIAKGKLLAETLQEALDKLKDTPNKFAVLIKT